MAMYSVPLLAAIGALLLATYRFLIYPAFISPLAKIPAANFTAHLSPFWIYYIRLSNQENGVIYDLHKKLGPIVRTAPNELSVNCYDGGLQTIYTGGFPKSPFYLRRFRNYGVDPMFAMIDKKEHSIRKRMLSNVYSKSYVFSNPTAAVITKAVLFGRLLPIFQASSDSGQPVEVHELDYAYAMDSFMAYQFGLEYGSHLLSDVKERKWYLSAFFSQRPYMFWTCEVPGFTALMSKIGINLVPKSFYTAGEQLEAWNLKKCDQAEKMLTEKPNEIAVENQPVIFARERLEMRKWAGATGHSTSQLYPYRLEIASDMYDHNAAAHETSGDTLTYCYYELSRRPVLQKQLRDELLTLSPQITYPPSDPDQPFPDPKAVDALPILDAVLQETLRLWVAVPGGQPRITPTTCSLAGYDNIPPGVRVQAAGSVVHMNPEVFPEPYQWRPERWLNASEKELINMRHWFWAWGSGGQMCIGSNIATHSMKHAIAGIYTNFTTSIVEAPQIELAEGFTAGPKGNKLILQFKHV